MMPQSKSDAASPAAAVRRPGNGIAAVPQILYHPAGAPVHTKSLFCKKRIRRRNFGRKIVIYAISSYSPRGVFCLSHGFFPKKLF
jgi:hypothetical protein